MRPWTWSDYTEAMLVPHGKRECWPGRRPRVLWFHKCTVVRPMTHARLWALEIPKERYYTLSRWAAITWVPATPTGRTLSLTRSVAAHLSDLWATWWQMWHQFHFGGVAGYRYFLHNRKCRPCGLHARSLCSQWTGTLPAGHSAWWRRCCCPWLPLCAECSSIWSLEDSRCPEPIGCTHNCRLPFHRWNT